MEKPTSVFDFFINRSRSIGRTLLVCIIVLILPFLAALLDGNLERFLRAGEWRTVLYAPTIALYIWIVSPFMSRAGDDVINSLRPLVQLNDEDFTAQVHAAEYINPKHEILATILGGLLGIIAISADFNWEFSWISLYWFITTIFMYGILVWTIFIAVISTRFNAALHRMPLKFDILDPTPFELVGRQSLLLALVFIGGITISLVFTYSQSRLMQTEFWISNLIFMGFILLVFFLSMRPTHGILAAEKKRRLDPVTKQINQACQELVQHLEAGNNPGELSSRITALVAYEKRLQAARTWPYNTSILRTLFFSVFIPLLSILARLAADLFFP